MRKGQLGRTIQQTWVLLQDLHQLSAVQGGKNGRARARRMESLMKVRLAANTESHHILGVFMGRTPHEGVCYAHSMKVQCCVHTTCR